MLLAKLLIISKDFKMAMSWAENTWVQQTLRQFLYFLSPEKKTLVYIKEMHKKQTKVLAKPGLVTQPT